MKELYFRLSLVFLIVGIVAAIFAPAEKTLGKLLGLIYLHIGFVYGALLLFCLSAGTALVYLVRKNKKAQLFSRVSFQLAFAAWVIYLALSAVIAIMSWGSINWQEPRWVIGINIFFFSLLGVLLAWWAGKEKAAYIYLPGSVFFVLYWSTRTSELHPYAPIRLSDSLMIKTLAVVSVFAVILSLFFLALAIWQKEKEA